MHEIKTLLLHFISELPVNIVNLSLLKNVFPDKLKLAKVILVNKAEDPSHFVNYRPISLPLNF